MKITKKWVMLVCMGMMFLTGATGCAKTAQPPQQTREENSNEEDMPDAQKESDNDADGQEVPEEVNSEADSHTDTDDMDGQKEQNEPDANNKTFDQSTPRQVAFSEGTEHLGGKVQSVSDDGMILAQTTVMGEGEDEGMVTIVDEKDAKKISVQFTADTKVEHWVIQGGGAGIDMQDAEISDIKASQGVELEGNYEGENFVASRVLIEEYK